MSIKNQATFWFENVNVYNEEDRDDFDLSDGCRAFSDLMKMIYEDYKSFEVSTAETVMTKIGIMADDLENYHNLTETIDCIYQMATVGLLNKEENLNYLEIEKYIFKKAFKSSATFPMQMLENYGFYFKYFKNGKEISTYRNCNKFHLFYNDNAELIPVMKYMSEELPKINAKEDYIGKKNFLFSIADFDTILQKNSTKQFDVEPLKSGIINTTGSRGDLWRELIRTFVKEMELTVKAYINPYVFPHWTVKMRNKKKTIVTFYITPDVIKVEIILPYETAKEVIENRENLPNFIDASIDRFGCRSCGKCQNQSNMELFEGVNLCKLSSTSFLTDSRIITGEIASVEDVAAICNIVNRIIT